MRFRHFILSTLLTLLRFSTNLLMNKIFVLSAVAQGVIIWADFNNKFNLYTYLSGGIFSTGIIRHNARRNIHLAHVNKAYVLYAFLMCGLVFLFLVFSEGVSSNIYHRIAFAIAVLCNTVLLLYNSKLNGELKFTTFFKNNFQISIIPIILILLVFFSFTKISTLIYSIGIVSASILIIFSADTRKQLNSISNLNYKINHKLTVSHILPYAVQSIVTFVIPISFQIHVRDNLYGLGQDAVVTWQIMWSLNLAIVSIIGSSFVTLLLPYFASRKLKECFNQTLIFYVILLGCATALVYLVDGMLKERIISILYSNEVISAYAYFSNVLDLLYIKIASWLLGIIALAKGYIKTIVAVDLLFYGSLYILSSYNVNIFYDQFDRFLFYSLLIICIIYFVVLIRVLFNED